MSWYCRMLKINWKVDTCIYMDACKPAAGTRYLVLGTTYLVPGIRYMVLGYWYLVPGTWCKVYGTGYLIPSTRNLVPTWYQAPSIASLVPGTRYLVRNLHASIWTHVGVRVSLLHFYHEHPKVMSVSTEWHCGHGSFSLYFSQ